MTQKMKDLESLEKQESLKPASKIALISRMSTENAGNEALSVEFIEMMRRIFPASDVRAIDRYPQYLLWLQMRHFDANNVFLIRHFDRYVESLLAKFVLQSPLCQTATRDVVKLIDGTDKKLPGFLANTKRRLGARRRLSRIGLVGADAMASVVATLRWAEVLVWNPAGEIHPTGSVDEVLRILVLIRMGQLLGKRTFIINHSLEVDHCGLETLIKHVYSNTERVAFRDAASCRAAEQIGLSKSSFSEIPDIVFLTARGDEKKMPPPAEKFTKGAICLAINGLEAYRGSDEWNELLEGLSGMGRPIYFLSNAMSRDLDFARSLNRRFNFTVIERQPSYLEIRGFYTDLGVLVSSRLHSTILALAEGVPVVTLEPSTFKLTAILEQLDYPLNTLRTTEAGWAQKALEHTDRALSEQEIRQLSKERSCDKARNIDRQYREFFQSCSDHSVETITDALAIG